MKGTELRYEPLPRIRQRLPFKHPMHRRRVAALEWALAVLLAVVLLLLWWVWPAHAKDPNAEDYRQLNQTQQQTDELYDYWQRERFHADHETDRRVYGVNPPQEEIRTYHLPEGDDDGDD